MSFIVEEGSRECLHCAPDESSQGKKLCHTDSWIAIRGDRMPALARSLAARKSLAGAWFAAFGFLTAALFFLRWPMFWHITFLYVVLPCLSAGAAGYFWGSPILDPKADWGILIWRSIGVTAGAYLMFSLMFACGLPMLEGGWSFSQSGGLFLMTLMFGPLMVGPIALLLGITAGLILHKVARSTS
jgi:hypothetical protein